MKKKDKKHKNYKKRKKRKKHKKCRKRKKRKKHKTPNKRLSSSEMFFMCIKMLYLFACIRFVLICACEIFSLKKKRFKIVLRPSFTMLLTCTPPPPTCLWRVICTHLFLFMIICENLFLLWESF